MDAVSNGTVECNHVLSTAYIGKNTALTFDTGLSFGLSARQHNAWIHYGGGMALRALYKKYNIVNHVCGNVGADGRLVPQGNQVGRRPEGPEHAHRRHRRHGAVRWARCRNRFLRATSTRRWRKAPSTRPNGSGPTTTKLGFNKVAPYYYSPGWFEGSASITSMVHDKAWEALPPAYQAAFEAAAGEQTMRMLAHYDARNPLALRKLIAGGAKVASSQGSDGRGVQRLAGTVGRALCEESGFRGDLPRLEEIPAEQAGWFRVAESPLDNYTFAAVAKAQAK